MRQWYLPATLALLEGTPINCLLVTWSAGANAVAEQEQRRLVTGYAREARGRRIAVLGVVYPGSDVGAAASSALAAGLDGLVLEGAFPESARFAEQARRAMGEKNRAPVVFPMAGLEQHWRGAQGAVLAVSDSIWPGVRTLSEKGVTSGPSGDPWLDSNGWRVRSLRSRTDGRPVWLGHWPEKPRPNSYPRAVADAAMAGGRWIVTLDDELRVGLFQKQPAALATWRQGAAYIKFFEDHAEWRRFLPRARLAVMLDAAGKNSAMSVSSCVGRDGNGGGGGPRSSYANGARGVEGLRRRRRAGASRAIVGTRRHDQDLRYRKSGQGAGGHLQDRPRSGYSFPGLYSG